MTIMTLEFGKNLKKLRREKDLTQDELAEQLAISAQAISRYETGAAYPDIEMLPVIAGFFGVTIDSLLGMSDDVRERRMDEYCDKLRTITDRKERLALLRRQHAEFPDAWNVVSDMVYEMTHLPECLEEMRRIVADAVKNCDDILWRENMVYFYLQSEPDEDTACAFIEKWCSRYDMRKPQLLEHHYAFRKKQDERARLRQKMLRDNLMESIRQLTEWLEGNDAKTTANHCEYALTLLDQLSGNPDRRRPDMWADIKQLCLQRLANSLFCLSENDRGFAVLEDAVSLSENLFALPNGTVLTYGTPKLDRLSATTHKHVYHHITEFSGVIATAMMMDFMYQTPLGPVDERDMEGFAREMYFVRHFHTALQNENGVWGGFDRVKEDPRYLSLKERVKRVSSIESLNNLMFMMHHHARRTDEWVQGKKWACALLVKGVGAYVMWDDADYIEEILGRMKKEGNTAVYRVAMIEMGGDLIEPDENIKRRILELDESNRNAEILLRGADGQMYQKVLGS